MRPLAVQAIQISASVPRHIGHTHLQIAGVKHIYSKTLQRYACVPRKSRASSVEVLHNSNHQMSLPCQFKTQPQSTLQRSILHSLPRFVWTPMTRIGCHTKLDELAQQDISSAMLAHGGRTV